jgi:dephospho-CoA kinase
MLRVGLTGGLASGKTFVGHTLADFGAHIIHADELGHLVLAKGGAAFDAVVAEFGEAILAEGGGIDRRKLAREVFGRPERLEILNKFVHPPVIQMEEDFVAEVARKDPTGIVVVEAAILIETGSYKRFDRLILVVCTEEQQIERAMKRDGLTREEAESRLERQMPLTEKRKFADYIVDTSGTKESTIEQTRLVYESLRSIRI